MSASAKALDTDATYHKTRLRSRCWMQGPYRGYVCGRGMELVHPRGRRAVLLLAEREPVGGVEGAVSSVWMRDDGGPSALAIPRPSKSS